jgi:hypothetical protein
MADDASDSGFSVSGIFSGINDTFSELAKTYLNIQGVKAQTGALQAQAQYQALGGYNSSLLVNPNATPLTAAQIAALQAQYGSSSTLTSYAPLLLLGVGIVALVLVMK